jgi:hypothetical protein
MQPPCCCFTLLKNYSNKSCIFSKICFRILLQDSILCGCNFVTTSQVYMLVILVLLIVWNKRIRVWGVVAFNVLLSLPNFTEIHPAVFQLNHADRLIDMVNLICVHFMHSMQKCIETTWPSLYNLHVCKVFWLFQNQKCNYRIYQ